MHRSLALVALAFLGPGPAAAMDLPVRKAGLWELTMAFDGGGIPTQAMAHCTDAATDKLMTSSMGGPQAGMCSKQEVRKVGSTLLIDSVCTVGPATMTSHAVVSGDFNAGYTIKVKSKREGGPAVPGMPAETSMTIDAKWTGACRPGQRPGDIIMANGMKMNISDLQRLQKGLPAGR